MADPSAAHRDLFSPPVKAFEQEQPARGEVMRDGPKRSSSILQGRHVRDRIARRNDEIESAPECDVARVASDEARAPHVPAPRGGEHFETHVETHGRSYSRELRRNSTEPGPDLQNVAGAGLARGATPELQMGSGDGLFFVEGKNLAVVVPSVGDFNGVPHRTGACIGVEH